MDAKSLTQRDLMDILGVSLDRVKSLTSGRVAKFKPEEIRALVEDLNVSADWLTTGSGPMFRVVARETQDEFARRMQVVDDLGAVVDALPLSAFEKVRIKAALTGDVGQDAARIAAPLALSPEEQLMLDRYRSSPRPLKDAALRVLLDSENPENGTKSQSGANASGTFKSRGRQINVTSHGGQAAGRDIVTGKKSRKHE